MGSSNWSDSSYTARDLHRKSTGTPTFAYNAAIDSGAAPAKTHDLLNPHGVKFRESRDSDAHPQSLAIAVIFDVTGSMGGIPVTLQKKLAGLMNLLLQKGYVADPQILFGAVGDATCDRAPLQIGQFESGLEMEDDLTKFYLEGGGGGQTVESYQLAHYFIARHTAIDCFEKRGQKGYLFTMGDESLYPEVNAKEVKDVIGDTLQANIPTPEIIKELQQRYHVFHLIVEEGSYPHHKKIEQAWRDLLGERVLPLEKADLVAETIAMCIGLQEGTVDLDQGAAHLKDIGTDAAGVKAVTTALTAYAASAVARPGTAVGLPVVAATGSVEAL